jgi:hypothetical protein
VALPLPKLLPSKSESLIERSNHVGFVFRDGLEVVLSPFIPLSIIEYNSSEMSDWTILVVYEKCLSLSTVSIMQMSSAGATNSLERESPYRNSLWLGCSKVSGAGKCYVEL